MNVDYQQMETAVQIRAWDYIYSLSKCFSKVIFMRIFKSRDVSPQSYLNVLYLTSRIWLKFSLLFSSVYININIVYFKTNQFNHRNEFYILT